MKNAFKAVALAMVFVLGMASPASAVTVDITGTQGSPTSNCWKYTTPDPLWGTFMVGDSLSSLGKTQMLALRPYWHINSYGGRNVDCLTRLLINRVNDGSLHTVVVELGTNAVESWGLANYRNALSWLPDDVKVILVTPYRDPAIWTDSFDFRRRASTSATYAGYMADLADERPLTCLAYWRSYASSRKYILSDGVHVKDEYLGDWATVISNGVSSCS